MKMVEKKSHNLMKNFIAGFIAVALLVLGVCFCATDSGLVMASDSKVKIEDGGYAVKTYSATDFAKFRGDKYTYPKLTAADRSDYQEWLFAGWFTDETCKTSVGSEAKTAEGNVYAKFVDADLSYIKCQVTPETDVDSEQAHMRVISTVDSKYYSGTGFYITYKGREPKRCETDNVYRRLSATDDGMECAYSPIAFNEHAEYLFALRLTDIGNTNFDEAFYIQSYWVTLDGTEVLGMSRYARIEDSYEKIVNVPVRLYASDVEATSGSVSVTYDPEQFSLYTTDEYTNGYDNGKGFTVTNVDSTTASGKIVVTGTADNEVAEGLLVNLRLQLKKDATLQSNTTFVVDEETFVNGETNVTELDVSDVIFKNYPVAYSGNVDTSWYDGFENNRTFVISSAADLYGLAKIVNDSTGEYASEQFSGDTIILGSDITINTATLDPEADDWAMTAAGCKTWTPIGKKGSAFAGIFDGRGNKISGIYVNATADNAGLFGVASESTIRDIEIKNSCFESAKGVLGSVVGCVTNTKFINIRSNAHVIGGAAATGGIVGSVDGASAEQNISNCWFDGNITGTTYCGGIVGRFNKGTSTISDCLVTGSVKGNVSGNTASVGGIVGGMPAGNSPTLAISTSISVGSVEGVNAGGVIGYRASSSATAYATLTLNNLYTTHTKGIGTQSGAANPGNVKDTTNKSIASLTINGHVAYDTLDGFSILTSKVTDGVWAIREHSSNLKDGVPVPAAFADNEWIDVAWYYDAEKSDDEGETYSISTAEELYGFSAISQDYNFEGDTIRLANDITVNSGAASSWEKGTTTPARQWKPIGNSTTSFQGTFDGQKHFIKGIYVNATTQNVGLFGYAEGATIQDLQLINSYIHSTVDRVGGIAGYYTGDMYRVYCDAIVVSTRNDTKESDCGGLIGYYNGLAGVTNEISECWFAGTAKGYNRTGGIVGRINNGRKEISNTLVTGTVITTIVDNANSQIGGLVGSVNNYVNAVLDIKSSLGAGTMQVSYTGKDAQIGGVVGYKGKSGTVTINNVYTTFSTGLGGQNNTSGTSAVEDDYIKIESIDDINSPDVYTNDVMNLGYYLYDSTWVARTTDIPVPRCFVGTVVDENDIVEDTSAHTAWYDADPEATEFEIKTENDLLGLAVIVNEGEKFSGKTIKLAKDMDLNRGWNAPKTVDEEVIEPDITWTPIGNNAKVNNVNNRFQGTFDGQGNEIKGIYVDSDNNYIGLFGYVNNNAIIKNLRLTNSYFYGDSASALGWGSIAGQSDNATLLNIYSDAVMCYLGRQIGGFVGRAAETVTIERCWFDGEIDASYVLDGNANVTCVGGIVGASVTPTGFADPELNITNCLNTGNLKSVATHSTNKNIAISFGGIFGTDWNKGSVTITGCLNKGTITTELHQGVGAIIGYAAKSGSVYEITGCYALDTSIANQTFEDVGYIHTTNKPTVSPETQEARCQSKEIGEFVGEDIYAEGGLDLNYATWIARKNDVPVPIYFVGIIVAEEDTVEYQGSKVYVDTAWYDEEPNASTYSIETAHELAGLAQLVNDGITFENKIINLEKDIDLNKGWTAPETADDEVEAPVNTWTPIGNDKKFKGIFNGQGHEVKGVYVTGTTTLLGLFGGVEGTDSMIKNLSVTNSYVEHTGATAFVGGVAGYLNKGTISQVYCNAIVKSNGTQFGGIVGRAEGLVEACWFDGEVYANRKDVVYLQAAGVVGTSWSQTGTGKSFTPLVIRNCLNTGKVIYNVTTPDQGTGAGLGGIYGGDRGYTDLTVEDCINTGIIDTNQPSATGTIVGNVSKNTTIDNEKKYSKAEIINCYGAIDSISNRTDGRILGFKNSNCAVTETDNVTIETENLFGLGAQLLTNLDFVKDADEIIWAARRGQLPAPAGLVADNEKLPIRFGEADTDVADGATGDTAEDPYIIENVEELYGFAVLSRTNTFAGKFIKLSDDIEDGILNLNPGESAEVWAEGTAASLPWYSIGTSSKRFAGHFDGNGKTISGIYMNQDNSYLGLFAATETGSTITNLRLTNSYINYTGDGTANTGSIVGDLRGDMTNVYSDAIVNSNGTQTGGLIGLVNEVSDDAAYAVDITNCWYDGQLTSSKSYAGGLAAKVEKGSVNIEICLNTGEIRNTYSAGHAFVGGFCGRVSGQSVVNITDCIAAGKITDACDGKSVRSVVGDIHGSTVNLDSVFATKSAFGRALPNTNKQTVKIKEKDASTGEEITKEVTYSGVYNGTIIRTHKADRFIGYCVEEHTSAGLEIWDWQVRNSDVPVPACFSDLVTRVYDTDLDYQIGLDYLNSVLSLPGGQLGLRNAIDMGEGNYVITVTASSSVYNEYITKLQGELEFGDPVVDNSEGVGVDGVHSVSYKKENPDWVLTVTYIEATEVLTISINTDIDSLSDNLVYTEGVEDENYLATGDVTLSMLQLDSSEEAYQNSSEYENAESYYYGNSLVLQLPNGHFIINDGGEKEEFVELAAYLKAQASKKGLDKVYIDAWIVSHQHGDHFDVIKAVVDAVSDPVKNAQYVMAKENIYVDAFYISEPNAATLNLGKLDGNVNGKNYDDADKQYYGMTLFTKDENGEQSDIYRMQTGQRYYFNGVVMDVVQAQEQIPYSEYAKTSAGIETPDFNTSSTVALFTTSNNQKIFIGGDANYVNMQYIMDSYGESPTTLSNIDVFVALHHGKNTSMRLEKYDHEGIVQDKEPDPDNRFTDYLINNSKNVEKQFDVVLFPCTVIYDVNDKGKNVDALHDVSYAFPQAGEANEFLLGFVKEKQYYHYGNGTKEVTLSSKGISVKNVIK